MPTPLLSFPEIQENQSGKYITHNMALGLLEAIITRAISRSNSGAPSSPSNGDVYVVDDNSGDWSDAFIDDVACYLDGAWRFLTPIEGVSIWCVDENIKIFFDGSKWISEKVSKLHNVPEYDNGIISNSPYDINWENGIYQTVQLGADVTFTFSNIYYGHRQLRVKQDSTGGRTPTLPTGKWPQGISGETDAFSTNSGEEDILKIYYNGSDYYYETTNFPS